MNRFINIVVFGVSALFFNANLSANAPAAGDKALEDFVRAQIGDQHRVEIRFGKLARGTRLKPCRKIQPFLARGARLWGRSTIGIRCISGARWSVALPVTVRVFGMALVTRRAMRARAAIGASDVKMAEVELSRQPTQPIADLAAIDGQMTTRPIAAGQALMPYHVRIKPSVSVGDPIRVRVRGAGFSVLATGSALSPGSEGRPLRVRTDTGKVLMGVLHGRTVEISL